MASDYTHGEMEIVDQSSTFSGFIRITIWSSAYVGIGVLLMTLIFAVGMNWIVALMIGFVVGILIGMALNMKTAWYATLFGFTVFLGIIGLIAGLFGSMMG